MGPTACCGHGSMICLLTHDIHGLILGREITGIQSFTPRGNDMPEAAPKVEKELVEG